MTPSPNESAVSTALRLFLVAVLPAAGPDGLPVDVLQAQPNRVPEAKGTSFVVFTPLRVPRLSTNVDSYSDGKFTGSIAGATMTVTAVDPKVGGQIAVGSTMFGQGVAAGTAVTALGSGSGGVGTYAVAPSQTVPATTLSSGAKLIQQAQEWVYQLDFHGDPANDISGDMATAVATVLRDEYGVQLFANQVPAVAVPLWAGDPTQRPFFNDQQQVENRWVVEVHLQANAVVAVPQQYADGATIVLVGVQ